VVEACWQPVITGENCNKLLQLLVHPDESSSKVNLVVETTFRLFKERFHILKSRRGHSRG